MAKAIGRRCNIGLGRETTRGTGVAPAFWIPKSVVSFDDKVSKSRSTLSYGTIDAFGYDSLVAQKWAEGAIEGDILDKSFGLLLYAAFGTCNSAVFSGAYKHTFSVEATNQHDSLSIHIDEPNGDLIFELAMLESLELNCVPDDVVKFVASFKSKSSQADVGAATYSAENKFLGRHLVFKVATDTSGLAAATAISLKSLKLKIEKNLIMDQVLGTVQPEDIMNKQFGISGEIVLNYDARTYANYMLDGSYKAVRINLINSDITIGTTNPSFLLDLSRVDFDAWEVKRENDEIMTEKITFRALYDITNGNAVNLVELVNATASY